MCLLFYVLTFFFLFSFFFLLFSGPPLKGDGYIFHTHPQSQRVPGKERLREWYDGMLAPLQKSGIVTKINSLFDEYFEVIKPSTSSSLLPTNVSSASPNASPAGGSSASTPFPALSGDIIEQPPLKRLRSSSSAAPPTEIPDAMEDINSTSSAVGSVDANAVAVAAVMAAVKPGATSRGRHGQQTSLARTTSAAPPLPLQQQQAVMSTIAPKIPLTRGAAVAASVKGGGSLLFTPPTDVIQLKKGCGLPSYFAGDFCATEMERMIRDWHKKLAARGARMASQQFAIQAGMLPVSPTTYVHTGAGSATSAMQSFRSTGGGGGGQQHVNNSASNQSSTSSSGFVQTFFSALGWTQGSTQPGGAAPIEVKNGSSVPKQLIQQQSSSTSSDGKVLTRKRALTEPEHIQTVAAAHQQTQQSQGPKMSARLKGVAAPPISTPAVAPAVRRERERKRPTANTGFPPAGASISPLQSKTSSQTLQSSRTTLSGVSLQEYVSNNPPVLISGGQFIKVGDVHLPAHPIQALGARLKDMQREIFVVHLAPIKGKVQRSGSKLSSAIGPLSTIMDQDDLDIRRGGTLDESPGPVAKFHVGIQHASDGHAFGSTSLSLKAPSSPPHRGIHAQTGTHVTGLSTLRGSPRPVSGGINRGMSESSDTSDAEVARVIVAIHNSDVIEDEKSITCDFFDSRHGFLRMCQGNNYQFDTLRRAKHSSMMILWHLHNPSIPAYAHICNVCENDIGCGTRWHCEACFDYDICEECHASPMLQHPHELVPKRDSHILVELDETTGKTSPALPPPPAANSLVRRGLHSQL